MARNALLLAKMLQKSLVNTRHFLWLTLLHLISSCLRHSLHTSSDVKLKSWDMELGLSCYCAGMTIKFFALFFIQMCDMQPVYVSLLAVFAPLGVSSAALLGQALSKR